MNVHQQYPEFSPAPDPEELIVLAGGLRSYEDQKKLAPAQAVTNAAMSSSHTAMVEAMKAAGEIN